MTTNNSDGETERLGVEHQLPSGQDKSGGNPQTQQRMIAGEEPPVVSTDLKKAIGERDAIHDRLVRLQAEFENSRKRAAREQGEFEGFALAEVLKSLLPILDNLDRALEAPAQRPDEFRSGIELIRKQFEDALLKLGVDRIPAKGEMLDPRVHEAIEVADSTTASDNQVLEELQRGYKVREQLLRPAMVRVARNPKRASESEAT
jgi:molecular chaperone GrpE